jgi:hypothetical protein
MRDKAARRRGDSESSTGLVDSSRTRAASARYSADLAQDIADLARVTATKQRHRAVFSAFSRVTSSPARTFRHPLSACGVPPWLHKIPCAHPRRPLGRRLPRAHAPTRRVAPLPCTENPRPASLAARPWMSESCKSPLESSG